MGKVTDRQIQNQGSGYVSGHEHTNILGWIGKFLQLYNDGCGAVHSHGDQTENEPENVKLMLFGLFEINGQQQGQENTYKTYDVENRHFLAAVKNTKRNRKNRFP